MLIKCPIATYILPIFESTNFVSFAAEKDTYLLENTWPRSEIQLESSDSGYPRNSTAYELQKFDMLA